MAGLTGAVPTDRHSGRTLLPSSPLRTKGIRLGLALAAVVIMSVTVLLDRRGYTDTRDGHASALDAMHTQR